MLGIKMHAEVLQMIVVYKKSEVFFLKGCCI